MGRGPLHFRFVLSSFLVLVACGFLVRCCQVVLTLRLARDNCRLGLELEPAQRSAAGGAGRSQGDDRATSISRWLFGGARTSAGSFGAASASHCALCACRGQVRATSPAPAAASPVYYGPLAASKLTIGADSCRSAGKRASPLLRLVTGPPANPAPRFESNSSRLALAKQTRIVVQLSLIIVPTCAGESVLGWLKSRAR